VKKPAFEDALKVLAARKRQELGEHPSPDHLLAYHVGKLESEETGRVQDHLAICGECSQFVLQLGVNPNPESGRQALSISRQEVESNWEMLEDAIEKESLGPSSVKPFFHRLRFAYSLAALLMLGLLGLTAWMITNQDPMIRVNVPHEVLTSNLTRGGTEPDLVLQTDGRRRYLLIQNPGTSDYSEYRIELIDKGTDRILWRSRETSSLPDGDFSLEFNELPAPGLYVILLTGLDGDEEVELARYTLTVEEAK